MSVRALAARVALCSIALSVSAIFVGCETRPPVAPGIDAFRTDSGVLDGGAHDTGPRMDADVGPQDDAATVPDDTAVDADVGPADDASAMDAANPIDSAVDSAVDAATVNDAFVGPDTAVDAGPLPDTSGCLLDGGGFDLCACGTFGADCSTTACPSGDTCATDPCGRHCVPGGSACLDATDCPTGTACTAGYCAHVATCVDSRNCALGFACESGACVDRRIPCSPDANCPFGYACDASTGMGVCVRVSRPCTNSEACNGTLSARQICVDINGDGPMECQFGGGPCEINLDCAATGVVCTPRALTDLSVCGRYGPCSTVADCAAGMECRDLWGDGVPECVIAGGCVNTASCPSPQVCATAPAGGAPACLSIGG